jgi:hypothetical protein
VHALLDVLDSSPAFALEARACPQSLETLAGLIHLNAQLVLNLMSASPAVYGKLKSSGND